MNDLTTMKTPRFIYFDLGMVLLDFSVERMVRQMGELSGVAAEKLKEVLFDRGLMHQYETGKFSTAEFYELFCERRDKAGLRRLVPGRVGDFYA